MTAEQPPNNSDQGDASTTIHQWVEAYVLGALDENEMLQFEEHLLTCEQCEAEIERLTSVVHALPLALSANEAPRAGVWSDLIARIETEQRATPTITIPASTTVEKPSTGIPVINWMRAISVGSVAALALALVVVSAWANSLNNRLDDVETDLIAQQQGSSSDVRLYGMEAMCESCEGNGRVGIDEADHLGMVVAWNLNPEEEHQVWCSNNSGEKEMVMDLPVNENGGAMSTFELPNMPGGYSRVYVQTPDGTILYASDIEWSEEGGGWSTPTP